MSLTQQQRDEILGKTQQQDTQSQLTFFQKYDEEILFTSVVLIFFSCLIGIIYYLYAKKDFTYLQVFAIFLATTCCIGLSIIFPPLILLFLLLMSLYIIFKD